MAKGKNNNRANLAFEIGPWLVSVSEMVETPRLQPKQISIVAQRLVIPRLDRGIQER